MIDIELKLTLEQFQLIAEAQELIFQKYGKKLTTEQLFDLLLEKYLQYEQTGKRGLGRRSYKYSQN